ncbi:MAG: hypothetical protein OEU86_06445, partial [Gammaproteobacteria bacterium]|nr:hypothetical protein [Gammaproteobacteria bacterium]
MLAWRTPDILPLNAWIERLWHSSLLAGGAAGQRDLLSAAQFRQITDYLLNNVLPASLPGSRRNAGRMVIQAWQLCRGWQVSVEDLARTATSQDEQVFAQWAEAFRQRCAERDWVDSHSCIYSVRDDIASGAIQLSGPVRFIGFSSPEPQLVALSQVLQETGCWGGWGLPSSPEAISQRKLLCTDIRQENQSITNWVERSLAANPDALLGIVLPEAHDQGQSLRRSLHDHLAPGWQLSAAESCIVGGSDDTTLLDTGLVKAVMLALRISSGTLDYRELGHLLRSRYLQGWEKESEDRARLDLFCRHKNLHQIDVRSLLGLLERHEDFLLPGFIEILTEGSQLKSRERKSAAEWTAQIDNFLRNIGWGISCQLTSGEQNIVRRWQTVLEQFAALNDFVGKIGLSRVIGLLSELCREQSATTASGREPVQILGIAQATDYRFDGLWCAGMSSSAWPRAARMNPLISKLLQRDRGIPESLSGEFRHAESARFQSVIASAADV